MLMQMMLIHGIDELPFELFTGIVDEFPFEISTRIELGLKLVFGQFAR